MTILVGRWDCTTCGHVGNLGPNTKCSQCGSSRPENVAFYLPENAEEVTNAEEIEKAESGTDWICSHCASQNKALDDKCFSCGNEHSQTDGDKNLLEKEYNPDEVPTSYVKPSKKAIVPEKAPKKKLSKGCLISLLSVLGIGLILFILAFFTKEVNVKVTAFEWERKINADRYQNVIEEDWNVPKTGKQISSYSAIHHYNKVLKGYETRTRSVQKKVGEERYVKSTKDLGNGHFKKIYGTRPVYKNVTEKYQEPIYEQIPVYQTKYKYSIFKWLEDNSLVTKGTSKPAQWFTNDSLLNRNIYRIKDSVATYFITVLDGSGKEHKEKVNYAFWEKTPPNSTIKAKESSVYGVFIGLTDEAKETKK